MFRISHGAITLTPARQRVIPKTIHEITATRAEAVARHDLCPDTPLESDPEQITLNRTAVFRRVGSEPSPGPRQGHKRQVSEVSPISPALSAQLRLKGTID